MERPKLNFAQIKRDVNVLDVARRYGVSLKGPDEKGWYNGGKCPLPSHVSKKSNTSFAVNPRSNEWCCHSESCQKNREGWFGGDVISLVRWKENTGYYEAAKLLCDWFNIPYGKAAPSAVQTPKVQPGVEGVSPRKPEETPAEENKPLTFTLRGVDHGHEYLRNRGIEPDTAKLFGVGFFPGKGSMSGRIVIPISNIKGEVVAYVGRALNGEEPRYKLPPGFHKTKELFNLHRVPEQADTVFVVEGFFDTFKVHQAGFHNVVALMGCTASDEQVALLSRFRRVVVCLDGDEPGRKHQAELVQKLAAKTFVRAVEIPTDKQPDQLSSEELQALLTPVL